MKVAASIVTFRTPPQELRQALHALSESIIDRITVVDHSGNDSLTPIVASFPKAEYVSLRMLRIHIANMIRYFNKWGVAA